MTKNMGTADRVVRTIFALVFAFLYFSGRLSGTLGLVLLVLAVVFVLTSLVSFCPLYLPFGLSTRGKPAGPGGTASSGGSAA
jgi:hypothetical protein